MTRAAQELESGRLADVSNCIESVKNIAQVCTACAVLGWCDLWDEFTIWMRSCFYREVHASGLEKDTTTAGSSQSSTEKTQKRSCAELLDLLNKCAADPRFDTAKLNILSDTVREVCKEPPKAPWFQFQGPLWENRYGSDGEQGKK